MLCHVNCDPLKMFADTFKEAELSRHHAAPYKDLCWIRYVSLKLQRSSVASVYTRFWVAPIIFFGIEKYRSVYPLAG